MRTERGSHPSGDSYKGINPVLRAPPSRNPCNPDYRLTCPPPNTITCGDVVSTYEFAGGGEDTNIQCITWSNCHVKHGAERDQNIKPPNMSLDMSII